MSVVSKILAVLALIALTAGCPGRHSDDDAQNPDPVRKGQSIGSRDVKYNDLNPSLSADGRRVVFTTARTGALSLMKFNLDTDKAPQALAPKGVSLDYIQKGSLSPDGSWVLLLGSKNSQMNLYLQDYDGQQTLVAVTQSAASKSDIVWSSDSHFAAFVSADVTNGAILKTLVLIDLTTPTSPQIKSLTASGQSEDHPVFLSSSTGGPYTLVTTWNAAPSTSSVTALAKRTFASFSAAPATTEPTAIVASVNLVPDVARPMAALGAAKVLLITRVLQKDSRQTAESILVQSAISEYSVTDGTVTPLTSPGFAVRGVTGASSGEVAVWLMQQFFKCNGEKYGTTLYLRKDLSATQGALQPRTAAGEDKWELSADECTKKRLDGTDGTLDYYMSDAIVAGNSTESNFSVVYTTSNIAGEELRDTEIRHLSVVSGVATFTNISQNIAP